MKFISFQAVDPRVRARKNCPLTNETAAPLDVVCPAQRRWYAPIREGQLFRVVIALAASALYELTSVSILHHAWLEAYFIVAIVTSAVFGAVGALWPQGSVDASATWLQ